MPARTPIRLVTFLSTLPARGATGPSPRTAPGTASFLSTLPARGATPDVWPPCLDVSLISIHAPREGSDLPFICCLEDKEHFYPRSPRGERLELTVDGLTGEEISIHAPREGSDPSGAGRLSTRSISIHAPREGSDWGRYTAVPQQGKFLSTLPARGATLVAGADGDTLGISIHAPREGSDIYSRFVRMELYQFLSTLPARGATP